MAGHLPGARHYHLHPHRHLPTGPCLPPALPHPPLQVCPHACTHYPPCYLPSSLGHGGRHHTSGRWLPTPHPPMPACHTACQDLYPALHPAHAPYRELPTLGFIPTLLDIPVLSATLSTDVYYHAATTGFPLPRTPPSHPTTGSHRLPLPGHSPGHTLPTGPPASCPMRTTQVTPCAFYFPTTLAHRRDACSLRAYPPRILPPVPDLTTGL